MMIQQRLQGLQAALKVGDGVIHTPSVVVIGAVVKHLAERLVNAVVECLSRERVFGASRIVGLVRTHHAASARRGRVLPGKHIAAWNSRPENQTRSRHSRQTMKFAHASLLGSCRTE